MLAFVFLIIKILYSYKLTFVKNNTIVKMTNYNKNRDQKLKKTKKLLGEIDNYIINKKLALTPAYFLFFILLIITMLYYIILCY